MYHYEEVFGEGGACGQMSFKRFFSRATRDELGRLLPQHGGRPDSLTEEQQLVVDEWAEANPDEPLVEDAMTKLAEGCAFDLEEPPQEVGRIHRQQSAYPGTLKRYEEIPQGAGVRGFGADLEALMDSWMMLSDVYSSSQGCGGRRVRRGEVEDQEQDDASADTRNLRRRRLGGQDAAVVHRVVPLECRAPQTASRAASPAARSTTAWNASRSETSQGTAHGAHIVFVQFEDLLTTSV